MGVSLDSEIIVVHHKAPAEELADPEVLCIECGGSGQIGLNNFDHHETAEELPPACRQAFDFRFLRDPARGRAHNRESLGQMKSPREVHLAAHPFPNWPRDYEGGLPSSNKSSTWRITSPCWTLKDLRP